MAEKKKKKKPKKAKVISFKAKRQDIEVSELVAIYDSKCARLINDIKTMIIGLLEDHDGDSLVFLMNDLHTATKEISKRLGVLPGEDLVSKLRKEDQEKFRPKDDKNN